MRKLGLILALLLVLPSMAVKTVKYYEGEINLDWERYWIGVIGSAFVEEAGNEAVMQYLSDFMQSSEEEKYKKRFFLYISVYKDSVDVSGMKLGCGLEMDTSVYGYRFYSDSTLLSRLTKRINNSTDTVFCKVPIFMNTIEDTIPETKAFMVGFVINGAILPDSCWKDGRIRPECLEDTAVMYPAIHNNLKKKRELEAKITPAYYERINGKDKFENKGGGCILR